MTLPPYTIYTGSTPTLTCSVELSPIIDIPVMVEITLTGPQGVTIKPDALITENLMKYRHTFLLSSSVMSEDVYHCLVKVHSQNSFTSGLSTGEDTVTITVGMKRSNIPVSYTHLTLPTIYSV